MIKITYLPEPNADKSKYEHVKKKCVTFSVPKEIIYDKRIDSRLRISKDLEVSYEFKYFCVHCQTPLFHYASGSNSYKENPLACGIFLRCSCGEWVSEGSPFSGSWYGAEATYRAFTPEEKLQRMNNEIEMIKKKYDFLS